MISLEYPAAARSRCAAHVPSLVAAQILADGDVSMPLKVTANAISEAAKEKLAAAGGAYTFAEGRVKWTRKAHEKAVAAAAAKAPAAPAGKAAAAKKTKK